MNRYEGFEENDLFHSLNFHRKNKELRKAKKAKLLDVLYHEKIIYVMNNNGARNIMLHYGFSEGADYVLAWYVFIFILNLFILILNVC